MILRRITEHIKAQNWTAVALDFVIVVVGVFIGIQVANWNDARADRRRAENYLDRLTKEMTINRQSLEGRRGSYASQIENGLIAIDSPIEPADRDAAWRTVRSFFQASHAFTIILKRGTYDEIISSGDLALLNDQDLVNALSEFYTFAGFSTIEIIPDYRENIRRIIPFRLQQYLQSECYKVTARDIHQLVDCPPPDGDENLIELATALRADEELLRDLEYMLSFSGVSASIARNRINSADDVLAILANKTGSKEN